MSQHYLAKFLLLAHLTLSKLLTVFVGVFKCRKTNLMIFVNPGVKINDT